MTTQMQQLADTIQEVEKQNLLSWLKSLRGNETSFLTHIKPGRKYTKIDVGCSGKYMVENETGRIYGIKAYGVIHRGHFYGTLKDNIFQEQLKTG